MKKITFISFILLLLSPIYIEARIGWDFSEYSIHYGGSTNFKGLELHSFEFTFDRGRKNCLGRQPFYHGIGISSSFSKKYQEYSIKAFINPTKRNYAITRRLRLHPYTFIQGNQTNFIIDNHSDYNYRVGIGINSRTYLGGKFMFRTILQVGYNFNDEYLANNNKLFFELKIGIGINARSFLKRNKKDSETS